MRFDEVERKLVFEKPELNIATLSIVELGGPFHSQLAKHLNEFHASEYKVILGKLYEEKLIVLKDLPLLIDTVYLLLEETLESDFGTYYEDIEKKDVQKFLGNIRAVYEKYSKAEKVSTSPESPKEL